MGGMKKKQPRSTHPRPQQPAAASSAAQVNTAKKEERKVSVVSVNGYSLFYGSPELKHDRAEGLYKLGVHISLKCVEE